MQPPVFKLRDYQRQAVDSVVTHFRRENTPAVVVLPTGSGKSLVIAELARLAKRGCVLVLAHVQELVLQNYQKFVSLGGEASIFSAGLGEKSLEHSVIFASVQSLARHVDQLHMCVSLVVVDECHRVSIDGLDQYHTIFQAVQKHNANVRVLGLTATPYRLGSGWIYQLHHHGVVRTHKPRFFKRCIFELPLRQLIERGYLANISRVSHPMVLYDFSKLTADRQSGDFSVSEIEDTLKNQPQVTPDIVADILRRTQDSQGVMIFAASCQHARAIHQLLPQEQSARMDAQTPRKTRAQMVQAFKNKELKYLVNVAVLTTGFDAPHVDVIAILRPTASTALYVQMVGRGLRLAEGKQDCLLLDYAGNHFDLFQPDIGEPKPAPDTQLVQVLCPACGFANLFWGYKDAQGQVIEHFGRRCHGFFEDDEHNIDYCDYRFQARVCEACGAMNDIAARICKTCHTALVDPDNRLKQALLLKDGFVLRCCGLSLHMQASSVLQVIYHDEDGATLAESYPLRNERDKRHFRDHFLCPHWHLMGHCPDQIDPLALVDHPQWLKHPDFVIAQKVKKEFVIVDRIFHYQGRYRKAHEMV